MKYFIIAFDGGGARLLLQWTIFKRIIDEFPEVLKADVYAGTSAGSIIASAMAAGKGTIASQIFTPETVRSVFDRRCLECLSSLDGLISSKYSNHNLRKLLENHFGALTFADLPRTLFIPAFQVTSTYDSNEHHHDDEHEHLADMEAPEWLQSRCRRWHPIYYHNLCESHDELDEPLVKAIMQSTAAPYYFPTVEGAVDGGVFANNPSLAVISHLLALGVRIEDICVLSIGSGEKPFRLQEENAAWGLYQWAPHLLNMIFDANQEAIAQQCWEILGERFHRVFPLLPKEIALDSAEDADLLIQLGEQFDLTKTFEWLQKFLRGDNDNADDNRKDMDPQHVNNSESGEVSVDNDQTQ